VRKSPPSRQPVEGHPAGRAIAYEDLAGQNRRLLTVMAGLDPAIYVFAGPGKKDVDARDKPAHDE
jgi:hypothetical protein